MTGGAAIARKFGFSVLYMSTDILSRGHYSVTFKEICRDASSMSVEEIMDTYYKMLEEDIDRQPWNYLWTHKRWK
jgi:KDO2-lipid IV(A) lauroyltransferase